MVMGDKQKVDQALYAPCSVCGEFAQLTPRDVVAHLNVCAEGRTPVHTCVECSPEFDAAMDRMLAELRVKRTGKA